MKQLRINTLKNKPVIEVMYMVAGVAELDDVEKYCSLPYDELYGLLFGYLTTTKFFDENPDIQKSYCDFLKKCTFEDFMQCS